MPYPRVKPPMQRERPPFECIALVLQGGGALGAYQGGVYQALSEAGIQPDWVAGISIGAINSALIAGNAPEQRVEKLRAFWESITIPQHVDISAFMHGDLAHGAVNQMYAGVSVMQGIQGFFKPRMVSPWLCPSGSVGATSFFDTSPLKSTLERFVDFDRINNDGMRFSVGAVNVRNGNFVYFDNARYTIAPEHIMASGALPPGFPPVEIEGELYWDGGLVSNTPLEWVLSSLPQKDTLAFQVDLWSARGSVPRDMSQVLTRQKEIQYSSRTRASTDRFRALQKRRYAIANLLDKMPDELKSSPDAQLLHPVAVRKVYNIVELIYHSQDYEGDFKDYEFSRASMENHWQAGYYDTVRTLRHESVLKRPENGESVQTFDMSRDGKG
ncbi:MAG: patatin-like phospholipase family protein [Alphaproteobacteria bacterium]|nr:patatin-like phospholipase family protein [Alphaproteobacteria bacterium]